MDPSHSVSTDQQARNSRANRLGKTRRKKGQLIKRSLLESNASEVDTYILDPIIRVVRVDDKSFDDSAIVQPIVTILQTIKSVLCDSFNMETQDKLFGAFVLLLRNENSQFRNAGRESVMHLNIS